LIAAQEAVVARPAHDILCRSSAIEIGDDLLLDLAKG
jgi:hypothetical protein